MDHELFLVCHGEIARLAAEEQLMILLTTLFPGRIPVYPVDG